MIYWFSIPIYTQSLELSFSNLQFMVRTTVHAIYGLRPSLGLFPPSFITLFASPVHSYGGDATLHTFFMIRPFSLFSNKIETHSSLSYLLHQSCL